MENKTPRKSIFILISGLLFSGLGAYITYGHFFGEKVVTNLRLVLAIAMIAYGAYRLYTYFKAD